MTRFVDVGAKVYYEIAQEKLFVRRTSGDSHVPNRDEIEVINDSNVR